MTPETPTPEELRELARFPVVLRRLVEAELAAGNSIIEIGHSFPAPPAGAWVRLARRVSTRPHASDDLVDWRSRYSSTSAGEFTDAGRFYFVVEPAEDDLQASDPAPLHDTNIAPPPPAPPAQGTESPAATTRSTGNRQETAFSGPARVTGLSAGVRFELELADTRTPDALWAFLEQRLSTPFSPALAPSDKGDRLHLGATLNLAGAHYRITLAFEAAGRRLNRYHLVITATWAVSGQDDQTWFRERADSWFRTWCSPWPQAQRPLPTADDPARYRQLTAALLAQAGALATIGDIQAAIIGGMQRGGWYAAGDKEGTTRLHWNGSHFVSFTEGDHIAWPPLAGAAEFLDRLSRFVNLPNHHTGDTPGTSTDSWRLILRQMKAPS